MNLTDALTLFALFLTIIALVVVAYQMYLTRKSLKAAQSSIELSIKTMQIEMLPKAGWAIEVRVKLKGWINDLKKVVELSNSALETQNSSLMKRLSEGGMKSPKGLVRKSVYEHAPNWLSIILISGAQYYYDAKAPQLYLWDSTNDLPKYDFVSSFLERCEDSLNGLNKLLTFIDDTVPEVYLNCPASLNDRDFFDE
jgi:hypothetical protein